MKTAALRTARCRLFPSFLPALLLPASSQPPGVLSGLALSSPRVIGTGGCRSGSRTPSMLIPAPTVLIVSDRPGAGHQPSLVQALVVSCLDYASHHLVSSLPALTYKNGLSSFVWRVRGAASPLVPPLLFTWCWMPIPPILYFPCLAPRPSTCCSLCLNRTPPTPRSAPPLQLPSVSSPGKFPWQRRVLWGPPPHSVQTANRAARGCWSGSTPVSAWALLDPAVYPVPGWS